MAKTKKKETKAPVLEEVILDEPIIDVKIRKKGKKRKFIFLFITILIIAFIIGILFFNLFNIRNKYLSPILSKIPIVNNIVKDTNVDPYAGLSDEQLAAKIVELEKEIESKNAEIDQLEKMQEIDVAEIARLQDIEARQLQYKKDKEEFDKLIALNDPNAYQMFYEDIAPENAELLYKEAVTSANDTKEFKKYIATISAMDEGEAAKTLEELMTTDMALVVLILENIDADKSGAILNNMAPENAAIVVSQMAPIQNE